MRKLLLTAILVGLGACGSEPTADIAESPDEPGPANETAEPLPDADINASLGMLGEAPGEPGAGGNEGTPRFVGQWAAETGLCETAAWRFTSDELRTPAGSVCRFEEVRRVPGGYDIEARCTAEGPEQEDVLEIRFAESAGAMLFESRSVAGDGLVRCEG